MRYIISPRLTSAALLLTGTALSAGFTSAALAEVPRVVTDVPPVHALVSLVMGDLGQPELLLERGASEHHFQLRPSQAVALSEADLVVMIGPELTPWIEQPLTLRPEGSAVLGLLAAEGTHLQNYAENGDDHDGHDHGEEGHKGHDHAEHDHADHDHDHDHDHSEEAHSHDDHGHEGHDHDEHGHSHSGTDPHAWLDPANGQLWLGVIAAELGKIDPENAATYAANAEAAKAQIAAADQQAKALLDPVKSRAFVGFHDAFGYYTGHYGLTSAGSVSPGDASTPGAKHLTELKAKVAAGEVICLFPEAGQDPALATRVAENTGVKIGAPLDPVGTLMEPGPGLYAALITGTAETLASCLTP